MMFESRSPKGIGYRWPAEWEPHQATWISWPHKQTTWPGKFPPIPKLFAQFVDLISRYETVNILASGESLNQARELTSAQTSTGNIQFFDIPTDDCWIRDHGPWFLQHPTEPTLLLDWDYNAWGGKYSPWEQDNAVPERIAEYLNMVRLVPGIIMEGGSVENNGAGTLLVTSQCLLNPNRNPELNQRQIEEILCEQTGAVQVLWLFEPDDGSLSGDDTDAHIDQLARFVSPSCILAVRPTKSGDENSQFLNKLHEQLRGFRTPCGQSFEIIGLPMPDPVYEQGERLPASYANFYIGNGFVILPVFNCPQDEQAQEILKTVFPQREIIPLTAVELIWGLGAFHCATMQQTVPGENRSAAI